MTLYINESDVRAVLTMQMGLAAVEEVSRKEATGEVVVHPRRRFEIPGGNFFHYMAAADLSSGHVATKQYTYVGGQLRFVVSLFDLKTGNLLALIEADYMSQVRTGAASGVATKFLARRDARVAAVIGTGGQARTQLEAVSDVCRLTEARAYGRDPQRREGFCREMSERLNIPVRAAASAGEATRHADVICIATTSSRAVLSGADVPPGAHINAIGANHAHKRELDDLAVKRASLIVVDSVEQSRHEAGDLIIPFSGDESSWVTVKKLSDIVGGKTEGRTSNDQVTLFKSNGIASWDLAAAVRVYAVAREKQVGTEIPFWQS
jgi:ornithine cyclodeaminase/alanine dehydrogenase-like protein (mu-crystallin family)